MLRFITEWGLIAGIAGLALGVFLILFREVIRKNIFPVLTKKQGFQIIIIFMLLVWSIAGYSIYIYFINNKKGNLIDNSDRIEKNNTGIPYEYSCKEMSLLSLNDKDKFAEPIEEELDEQLNPEFDKSIIQNECNKDLCEDLRKFTLRAESNFQSIIDRQENKNLENLVYLKNIAILGAYYRLAYLYAICKDTSETIKYSRLALNAANEGKQIIDKQSNLSIDCSKEFNSWYIVKEHNNRIPIYQLFSMAINYQYDKSSKVEKYEMIKLIEEHFYFLDKYYHTDIQYYGMIVELVKEEESITQKFIEFDGFN